MKLPMPLIPSDVDLRDFAFMPLQVERLRRSKQWLIAKRRPEVGFYSINLWMAAWHELPCGSLEDDDDVLADAAMCTPEQWPSVKADVLRGWIKCSDGRIYHQIVCEKAAEAWSDKVHYRWRKECERIRKENERRRKRDKNEPELDCPPEPQRISAIPQTTVAQTAEEGHVDVHGQSADTEETSRGRPVENALKVSVRDSVSVRDTISPSLHSGESTPALETTDAPIDDDVVVQLRSKSTRAKKPKRAETEWPADLELTPELRLFAEQRGYRGQQVDDLWQAFHNRSLAKAITNIDWKAAWRTWVLQQIRFDGQHRTAANAPRGRPPDV